METAVRDSPSTDLKSKEKHEKLTWNDKDEFQKQCAWNLSCDYTYKWLWAILCPWVHNIMSLGWRWSMHADCHTKSHVAKLQSITKCFSSFPFSFYSFRHYWTLQLKLGSGRHDSLLSPDFSSLTWLTWEPGLKSSDSSTRRIYSRFCKSLDLVDMSPA